MWSFALQAGFQAASASSSFFGARAKAKSDRAWQAYNNALTRLQGAENQNAITSNQIDAVERSVTQAYQIERQEYKTRGQVEAAAAAAGVAGSSVDATLLSVSREAATAQRALEKQLGDEIRKFDAQSRMNAFQTANQIDHRHIPNPSPVAALLGLGAGLNDTHIKQQRMLLNA